MVQTSARGVIDQPFVFLAQAPGDYAVWVQVGDQAAEPAATAKLVVLYPTTHTCAGKQPLAHMFGTGQEVLVQAKRVTLGGSVGLLGIGFPACSPVQMRQLTPDGFSVPQDTAARTDVFGVFRLRLHIPSDPQAVYLAHGYLWQITPYINGENGPVVTIAVEH